MLFKVKGNLQMFQIYYTKKEIAFNKWKESGYSDLKAHETFLYYFNLCQKELLTPS